MAKKHLITDREIVRFTQFVVGATLFVIGCYMIGPWYVVLPESAAFGILAEAAGTYTRIVAALQIVFGFCSMLGAFKWAGKVTYVCLWGSASMYTLIVVTRLINIGFVPFIWVYQLALLLIAGALALRAKER